MADNKTQQNTQQGALKESLFFTLPVEQIFSVLNSTANGLSQKEAVERLEKYGPNRLKEVKESSPVKVFLSQFTNFLIIILFIAAGISLAVGEIADAIAILLIVILNGILGFLQEWKAEKAIQALRKMLSLKCRIIRDGQEREIDSTEVVPGDIIVMEVGEKVPADAVLFENRGLAVDESLLTGESVSVNKNIDPVAEDTPLADRKNMVYMSTVITNGWAKAVVAGTGLETEIGRIAYETEVIDKGETPLQKKLEGLGKQIGYLALVISVLVGIIGLIEMQPLLEAVLLAISLAVAVVPEGLPAVVTITLALGIKAMVKRHALLRKLSAAEALGASTIICTDKTGTLTKNEMTLQRLWIFDHLITVSGIGYEPKGTFQSNGNTIQPVELPGIVKLLQIGLYCNHASLQESNGQWGIMGEPTEGALIVAARKAGMVKERTFEKSVVSELSFNSQRKRMTTVYLINGVQTAYTKGAPEILLDRCTKILINGKPESLTPEYSEQVKGIIHEMATSGLRTLGFAYKELLDEINLDEETVERDMIFVGVTGLLDPPRDEVKDAINLCKTAGIDVLMITGDAAPTAAAIARAVGLEGERALTGQELEQLNDNQLLQELRKTKVLARVSPTHKLRVVSLLQGQGEVVAMTGDGVNDAPALKKADIGIAMGLKGTDVAKGAADMILTDDNFASIVGAIEEGRKQFDNIIKFVRYLLTSNIGEIVAILGGELIGLPLILIPVQILWINLVTDSITALALGVEPKEPDVMDRPPRNPSDKILSGSGLFKVIGLGAIIGLLTLFVFAQANSMSEDNLKYARTMAFTGIIVFELINVFNFRSLRHTLYRRGFWSNPKLIAAWIATLAIQVGASYTPFFQKLLDIVPLSVEDWFYLFIVGLPVLLISELYKVIKYGRDGKRNRVTKAQSDKVSKKENS